MNILKNIDKHIVLYSAIVTVLLLASYYFNKKMSNEISVCKRNISVLMDSVKHYKVADSLNASCVSALEIELSEYKKYRKEDAELIKKLKADKPETIIKTVTNTEYEIKTKVEYIDTIKNFAYKSKWIDIVGKLCADSVNLQIKNRDELTLVESIQRKKIIGIKLPIWLFGYKAKTLDVVSKNPNTDIVNIEYVKISK